MDDYYLPHYNYCDYTLDRTNGCPNPCGKVPSIHHHWSGQHQTGNPYSNNQGHPPPSEDGELKQLLVKGFSEINAKLDKERLISESCFSNVLERMEQMEVKHEYLHSRVMQLSCSMNEQPTLVKEPISSDSLGLLDDDGDEEDEEVEETIICESPPLIPLRSPKSQKEVETLELHEDKEEHCIERQTSNAAIKSGMPMHNFDPPLYDMSRPKLGAGRLRVCLLKLAARPIWQLVLA